MAGSTLIMALDTNSVEKARSMVASVEGVVRFFKIGMELAYSGGLILADELHDKGYETFIDLKLHDIGNQVTNAARALSRLGTSMITVHAYPKTLEAAMEGVQGTPTRVLGVTVLTSFNNQDVVNSGYSLTVDNLVQKRITQVRDCKVDGVVCSAFEAAQARKILGEEGLVVTPGIRPEGADKNDQSRVATPALAVKNGATHLVVGRPIYQADNPALVAQTIIESIT